MAATRTANEFLLDAAVRHQVYLSRYSNNVVAKIVSLLNKTDADLVSQLIQRDPSAITGAFTTKRLQLLLDEIRVINRDAYNKSEVSLTAQLDELARYEAELAAREIKAAAPIKLEIVKPTAEMLRAAVTSRPFQGRLMKDWFVSLEATRFQRMRDAITIGYTEGETIEQMVKRLRGSRALNFRDGVLEISRRDADAVVRTAISHVSSSARTTLFQANEPLVKGEVWVSTLDTRTTPICRARDGKFYKLGEGPRPPAHVRCRSATAPVLASWEELGIDLEEAPAGTRASMNGQVAADLRYGDWLKQQHSDVIDEVLGKSRSKLFQDGKLTVNDFVNDQGHQYTLKELRQRDAHAFDLAGL